MSDEQSKARRRAGRGVSSSFSTSARRFRSIRGELSGGRPWYLRSFTRGPIEAKFPIADRPMRVVYWARWVGMTGDVGPFSTTCVAEFEGPPAFAHTALVDRTIARRRQQSVIVTTARPELPEPIERIEALPGSATRLLADANS